MLLTGERLDDPLTPPLAGESLSEPSKRGGVSRQVIPFDEFAEDRLMRLEATHRSGVPFRPASKRFSRDVRLPSASRVQPAEQGRPVGVRDPIAVD